MCVLKIFQKNNQEIEDPEKNTKDCEKFGTIFTLCWIIFSYINFHISVFILFSYLDGNTDECNNSDPLGLNLVTWLQGDAIATLIIISLTLLACIIDCEKCKNGEEIFLYTLSLYSKILPIFKIVYLIIGAITLYRSNFTCLASRTFTAIFTQIILILRLAEIGFILVIAYFIYRDKKK